MLSWLQQKFNITVGFLRSLKWRLLLWFAAVAAVVVLLGAPYWVAMLAIVWMLYQED